MRTGGRGNMRGEAAESGRPEGEADQDRIVEPKDALPAVSLNGLPEAARAACARAGWSDLMPVQAMAIPYILAGRDLMIQSRTGSGKTGAFVLPALERIDPGLAECQILVLVPTRELARQVARDAETLAGSEGIRTAAVYGGTAYGPQIQALRAGAQLVVGTPGRVLDHLARGTFALDELEMLVFDEADRMMSMGFYPDMRRVREFLPRRPVNAYMFSATFPPHVLRLAGEFLHKPEVLSLSRDRVHVTETEHVYYCVKAMEKDRALVRIIEIENPASAIIFCNTRQRVHYVSAVLRRFGYNADELSADLTQTARDEIMARARAGTLRFLVATDVASRGIDIPDLSHVVQYELQEDPEAYVHRAGRTGRAGASGEAIALVDAVEEMNLKSIAKRFKIDLQVRPLPSDEDVEAIVSQRVTALLEAQLRARDNLVVERMQRFLPLARLLGQDEDEPALLAMLLDDYYQQSLHGPAPAPPEPDAVRRTESSRSAARPPSGRGRSRRGGRRDSRS
jgi:ATP-dependent RNA helicase DeaD